MVVLAGANTVETANDTSRCAKLVEYVHTKEKGDMRMASNWMASLPRRRRRSIPKLYDLQTLRLFERATSESNGHKSGIRSVQQALDRGKQLVETAVSRIKSDGKYRGRGRRFRL